MSLEGSTYPPTTITLSILDGSDYLNFNPPLFEARMEACPWPTKNFADSDIVQTYAPLFFSREGGFLKSIGFEVDAFAGGNFTPRSYAEELAKFLGNTVVQA